MKKLLGATAASAIAAAMFGGGASADNYVYWDVDKDKDVYVYVETQKLFYIDVDVVLYAEASGSAQATALVNSIIDWNDVNGTDGYYNDMLINRDARTDGSLTWNKGIGQVNQDSGNFSNQGNVAAVAWNRSGEDMTMAEAFAEQNTVYNYARHSEFDFRNLDIVASLTNSLLYNVGVYHFNQNAGNGNAQHNLLALAIGDDSIVALSEAGLAQDNIGNKIAEFSSVKDDTIANSVNGNVGIVNANQAVGNFNNQATVYSVAVLSSSVGLGQ